MARLFRPLAFGDFVACISLVALLTLQLDHFSDDPGVGWHLQGGKLIAETGSAPTIDPFLSTGKERQWVSDQWLSDLVIYSLYKLGSWPLIYSVLILIYIGTYFALLLPITARITGAGLASVIAVFLAFKLGLIHFILRPVVFTFPLFALLLLSLYSFSRRLRAGEIAELPRTYYFLPLLFLLWANIHPSFVLGLGFLLLLPLSVFLDRIVQNSSNIQSSRVITTLLVLFSVCALTTFVNPYGWQLHKSVFSLLSSDFFANLYEEWRSPNFKELPGRIIIFTLSIIALSAFITRSLKWGFFEVLGIIAVSYLAFDASRNLPFFGIAIAIPLTEALHALCAYAPFKSLPVFRLLARPLRMLELRERRALPPVLFTALVLIFVGVYAVKGKVLLFNGTYGPSDSYPHKALSKIPKGSVVASTLSWGGFIIYHCDLKAIIDDRSTVAGEQYYLEYFSKMRPSADWKQYLKEKGTTHLLLPPDSPIALAAESEGFALLHRDGISTLFSVP